MQRGVRVLVCSVLAMSIPLVSPVPANAQLQNLVDLLIPPKPPAPPPAAPAAPPPGAPPAAPAPPAASKGQPAPAQQPFPFAVPNIKRSPPGSTNLLLERLKVVVDKGMPLDRAILRVVAPFPVAGPAKFSHDWGFPRYNPTPHTHKGTDIFAPFGTPIVTSESGRIAAKNTVGAGGISAWVTGDSGTGYYYAHMQSWVRGLAVGQRVEKGAIIGFIGNSGNAQGSPPHVHFQTHPGYRGSPGGMGTPPRDPKPFLDDALRQAEAQALALSRGTVTAVTKSGSPVVPLLVITKKVDKLLQSSSMKAPEDLLWYSMIDPTLGVLSLARQAAADAGVPARALSASDTKQEERMDAVRAAVASPQTKIQSFIDNVLSKDDSRVVGPVGLALVSNSEPEPAK